MRQQDWSTDDQDSFDESLLVDPSVQVNHLFGIVVGEKLIPLNMTNRRGLQLVELTKAVILRYLYELEDKSKKTYVQNR